jgi:hypothetical protein
MPKSVKPASKLGIEIPAHVFWAFRRTAGRSIVAGSSTMKLGKTNATPQNNLGGLPLVVGVEPDSWI